MGGLRVAHLAEGAGAAAADVRPGAKLADVLGRVVGVVVPAALALVAFGGIDVSVKLALWAFRYGELLRRGSLDVESA